MRLKNKVTVVTGSSSGIGLAIARDSITEGASVSIYGRNQRSAERFGHASPVYRTITQGINTKEWF